MTHGDRDGVGGGRFWGKKNPEGLVESQTLPSPLARPQQAGPPLHSVTRPFCLLSEPLHLHLRGAPASVPAHRPCHWLHHGLEAEGV